MEDQILTPHFKLSEFINSPTATRLHIDNTPSEEVISNLKVLCVHVLEPFREAINQPVVISSGYRCPKLNAAVGGAKNSQHMKGEAADIHLPVINGRTDMNTCRQWFLELMNGDFDQLIKETADRKHYWIHVSCKSDLSKNRRHVISFLKKSSQSPNR